jgi:signal transduction histidine kinase
MERARRLIGRFAAMPAAQRVDVALAPVLVLWLLLQVALMPTVQDKPTAALVGGLVCAGVALRRTHPVLVGWGTQLVLSSTHPSLPLPAGPVTIGWFCALYALAVWTTARWFACSVVMVVLANGGTDLLHLHEQSPGAAFGVGAAVAMVLVRVAVGGRDRQLVLARREREVAAREAVVDERARIARELHDVVAHHVSTMVVQAGAERRMVPPDQHETREVLGSIERTGRGALTEMRRMVAMLRQDPAEDLAPQPRLSDLPELVRQMQDAGLEVRLDVTGEQRPLADGIELSAYRIVQEALTNAYKHAAGARACVEVGYGPESLSLAVTDDGRGARTDVPDSGHGLVGMRERVALYGGTFEVGAATTGGFAVRVLLPVR